MTIHGRILLWQIKRDSGKAFETVYAEHGQRVYRFCHRLTMNRADAEDLAQEVFVAAFDGLERFEGRSSIATWLYRIVVLRWRTRVTRNPAGAVSLDALDHGALPCDSGEAHLSRLDLDSAIAALPESLRAAFVLVKAEGLTCREAAAVLQSPEGTVKYHVHQAVQKLRARLSLDAGVESPPRVVAASQAATPLFATPQEGICHDLQ